MLRKWLLIKYAILTTITTMLGGLIALGLLPIYILDNFNKLINKQLYEGLRNFIEILLNKLATPNIPNGYLNYYMYKLLANIKVVEIEIDVSQFILNNYRNSTGNYTVLNTTIKIPLNVSEHINTTEVNALINLISANFSQNIFNHTRTQVYQFFNQKLVDSEITKYKNNLAEAVKFCLICGCTITFCVCIGAGMFFSYRKSREHCHKQKSNRDFAVCDSAENDNIASEANTLPTAPINICVTSPSSKPSLYSRLEENLKNVAKSGIKRRLHQRTNTYSQGVNFFQRRTSSYSSPKDNYSKNSEKSHGTIITAKPTLQLAVHTNHNSSISIISLDEIPRVVTTEIIATPEFDVGVDPKICSHNDSPSAATNFSPVSTH